MPKLRFKSGQVFASIWIQSEKDKNSKILLSCTIVLYTIFGHLDFRHMWQLKVLGRLKKQDDEKWVREQVCEV
jgi:hypothetical protein